MPQNYKVCNSTVVSPFCGGVDGPEKRPYITNVNQTWAWSGKIQKACMMLCIDPGTCGLQLLRHEST